MKPKKPKRVVDDELIRRNNEQVRQLIEMLFNSGCKIVYTTETKAPERAMKARK